MVSKAGVEPAKHPVNRARPAVNRVCTPLFLLGFCKKIYKDIFVVKNL